MNFEVAAQTIVDNVYTVIGRPFQFTTFEAMPTPFQQAFVHALEAVFVGQPADSEPHEETNKNSP